MNFGNTLEEKYAKISAINAFIKKWTKVIAIVFAVMEVMMLSVVSRMGSNSIGFFQIVFFTVLSFLIAYFYAGRIYCWAWLAFCEKYYPKGLVKSLANAVNNSAIEGYILHGESGVRYGILGVVIFGFLFLAWYIIKGAYYMVKYWNLPKKEAALKKQLEAKYNTTL